MECTVTRLRGVPAEEKNRVFSLEKSYFHQIANNFNGRKDNSCHHKLTLLFLPKIILLMARNLIELKE